MESLDSNLPREGRFFGTQEINGYLMETAKWGKFLAIVGYVGIGMMILLALFVMVGTSQFGNMIGTEVPMGAIGLIYIVLAAVYFFPVYYLHQFSIKTKRGLESQDLENLTSGFQNLKSLYKFMGIFMIVILSLYALILLFAVLGAAVM